MVPEMSGAISVTIGMSPPELHDKKHIIITISMTIVVLLSPTRMSRMNAEAGTRRAF